MKPTLLLLSCVLLIDQAVPQRDRPAPLAAATAVVRGRVTSAATGEPLHRVRVTLAGPTQPQPSAVTDTGGEFEITNVGAGSYTMTATRTGYLTTRYGQRRPGDSGRPIEVVAGNPVERVSLALVRGGVLAGTITDDDGNEYPSVRVEALEYRYLRGRRILVPAAVATTNDLGQFRLSGLPPGPYFLKASTTDTWEGDDGVNTYAYVPTYYPGVTGLDAAESVSLGVSQEVASLNFGVRPGRSAKVTGLMQNAAGEPMGAQTISLSFATRGVAGALFSTSAAGSTRTDSGGAFEFRNLAPGEYLVSSGGDAERTSVTIILADGDVRAVTLKPRRPTPVSGTVVTDTGESPPFPPRDVRIVPVAADPESVLPSFVAPGATDVTRDWTFRFSSMTGPYLFRATGLPDEWMLSGVVLNGQDLTDTPLTIPPDAAAVTGVRIVVSKNAARLTGEVKDRDGSPMPDSTVLVFATEPARWSLASRFVHPVRPNAAGKFSIAGLVPGSYRAIAREFVEPGQWEDPLFLKTLTSAARFDARASETTILNLTLERPR